MILGALLDSDYDGYRDSEGEYEWWTSGNSSMAVPTQYYAVAVHCLDDGMDPFMCGYDKLDAIGFLLEHPLAPGVRFHSITAGVFCMVYNGRTGFLK